MSKIYIMNLSVNKYNRPHHICYSSKNSFGSAFHQPFHRMVKFVFKISTRYTGSVPSSNSSENVPLTMVELNHSLYPVQPLRTSSSLPGGAEDSTNTVLTREYQPLPSSLQTDQALFTQKDPNLQTNLPQQNYQNVNDKLEQLNISMNLYSQQKDELDLLEKRFKDVNFPAEKGSLSPYLNKFERTICSHLLIYRTHYEKESKNLTDLINQYKVLITSTTETNLLIKDEIIIKLNNEADRKLSLVNRQLSYQENLTDIIRKINTSITEVEKLLKDQKEATDHINNIISKIATISPVKRELIRDSFHKHNTKNSSQTLLDLHDQIKSLFTNIRGCNLRGPKKELIINGMRQYHGIYLKITDRMKRVIEELNSWNTILVQYINCNIQDYNTSEVLQEVLVDKPLIFIWDHPIISKILQKLKNNFPGTGVQKKEFEDLLKMVTTIRGESRSILPVLRKLSTQIDDPNTTIEMLFMSMCQLISQTLQEGFKPLSVEMSSAAGDPKQIPVWLSGCIKDHQEADLEFIDVVQKVDNLNEIDSQQILELYNKYKKIIIQLVSKEDEINNFLETHLLTTPPPVGGSSGGPSTNISSPNESLTDFIDLVSKLTSGSA